MDTIKKHWKSVPVAVRKPMVALIGAIFIIASGLTGWLPGPGGIPLLLIGVAILATEFDWAKRLEKRIVNDIKQFGHQFRQHKVIGTIVVLIAAAIAISLSITLYRLVN